MKKAHLDLKWESVTQDGFVEEIARAGVASSRRRLSGFDVTYEGRCPFCGGDMMSWATKSLIAVAAASDQGGLGGDAASYTVTMRCECSLLHPSTPAGEVGCGRSFDMQVAPRKRQLHIQSARPASPRSVERAARIRKLYGGQLSTVRAMAQNWRNGVGLATVLGGAVALLAIPDVIKSANQRSIEDGGLLLIVGAATAILSVLLSLRASFGWPKRVDVTRPSSLELWEIAETIRSVWFLRISVALAVVSLVALGLACAVLIFHVALPLPWR